MVIWSPTAAFLCWGGGRPEGGGGVATLLMSERSPTLNSKP